MPLRQRQGKLHPDFAHLYPGLTPDLWVPAAALTDWVRTRLPDRPRSPDDRRGRILDPAHFVFRTVAIGLPEPPDTADGTPGRGGRWWNLEDLAVRGPLHPSTQEARAPARADLPSCLEPGRWYAVFAGPFPLELEQRDDLYLVSEGVLCPVPRAWCEVRELER